jgi:hypothetical protein
MKQAVSLLPCGIFKSTQEMTRLWTLLRSRTSSWFSLPPPSCWFHTWHTIQPWRRRQHVLPKRWLTFTRLHGVISQRTKPFITTALRTSNPTFFLCGPKLTLFWVPCFILSSWSHHLLPVVNFYVPITVAARSNNKVWTVFTRSNTVIVVSNPTWGIDVCVHLFCVYAVLCAGSGLATCWSPVEGVLPTV